MIQILENILINTVSPVLDVEPLVYECTVCVYSKHHTLLMTLITNNLYKAISKV